VHRARSGGCAVALACMTLACTAPPPVAARDDPRPAADAVTVTPLGAGDAFGPLAASANGQLVFGIDESRRAVVAFDPRTPDRRRDAIAPAGAGVAAPVALGCLPGDLVAVVTRSGEEWALRTFRIAPAAAADPSTPVQSLRVGRAAGGGASVGLAVSQSRDWLAIAGLPEPVDPVVRAVFAGASVRPLSSEACPSVPAGRRVIAAAVSPADELVLVDASTQGAAPAEVSFHDSAGREILRVDTGLFNVRGAAFTRGDGALWLIADDATVVQQPAGLWRLDAVIRARRQAVRATCVARLPSPRGIACALERSIVVSHGGSKPGLVRIDPAASRRPERENEREPEDQPPR